MVMTDSLFQLYIAAADTLTNTMRWFVLILSLNQNIQNKCFEEVDACHQKYGKFSENNCNYLCATMEEVFRFRPVSDSLPHLVSEDTLCDGVVIPKGTRNLFS